MNDITALVQRLELAAAKGCCHTLLPDDCRALVEALEKAQAINAAAEKLVRCKGRYHSEQNYRALAALFGVNTPDLPPMEGESRTVTVKLTDYRATYTEPFALEIEHHVRKALKDVADAAGIQVIEGGA